MSGLPGWAAIAAALQAGIESGVYPAGSLIPSTASLAREHGVTAGPVQRAVTALKARGLVVGEPGRGVRVVSRSAGGMPGVEERLTALEAWRHHHETSHGRP